MLNAIPHFNARSRISICCDFMCGCTKSAYNLNISGVNEMVHLEQTVKKQISRQCDIDSLDTFFELSDVKMVLLISKFGSVDAYLLRRTKNSSFNVAKSSVTFSNVTISLARFVSYSCSYNSMMRDFN